MQILEATMSILFAHSQDRLKAYGKKVRKLESAEYLALHKPATEINIAAANRFINHAIPDLSKEQKAALKQVRVFIFAIGLCQPIGTGDDSSVHS